METNSVSRVSITADEQRAEMIVETAGRLFLAPGSARVSMDDLARELGMSKKTIYRHFPDRNSLLAAVLDRQFAAVDRTLMAAAEDAEGQPFDARVQRFLIAAGTELGRIGAAQLATGRGGDAMLRRYVEQRVDAEIYRRIDELFRDGHRRGLLSVPPELLGEITRGALERLFTSRLPYELEWTAADLLRATVDTVLHGAIRSAGPALDGERLGTVIPTARDDDEEVSP
ncbi:TetR/AcrR family transcriptional regulator [Streptomyces sp. NPDC090075]|uniref:TetR/AcrR family transcriptional regulator n=1 Tax=Streptomyces sp. NPDC090075 TaxID=3365937 RepID=UPI00380FC69F